MKSIYFTKSLEINNMDYNFATPCMNPMKGPQKSPSNLFQTTKDVHPKWVNLKNNRGSMTVEATLVVSTVILVIAGLLFAFMLLYQKVLLTKTASLAAQQGAEVWVDGRREMSSGLWEYTDENMELSLGELYYQLFDFGKEYSESLDVLKKEEQGQENQESGQNGKLEKIRRLVCSELYRGLLKPRITRMNICYSNYIVERKISVTLQQEIKIPLGGISAFFGGKDTMTLTGIGTAVVAEPAEYIRNIDLGLEYAKRVGDILNLENKINELKEKIIGGK